MLIFFRFLCKILYIVFSEFLIYNNALSLEYLYYWVGDILNSRKYINDYKLIEYIDDKGRTRREAEYIGGDYVFSPPVTKADKIYLGCFCALSVTAFVCALFPATAAARTTYVMIPFVFAPVPLYLMSSSVMLLIRAEEIMIRSDAERISKRLTPSALLAALLPAAALVGLLVAVLRSAETFQAGDLIFCLLSLVIIFSAAAVFRKSLKIKTIKLENSADSRLPASDSDS